MSSIINFSRPSVAVVFGGRSPIAVACTLHLSKHQDVILVTRKIDDRLMKLFYDNSKIKLYEADLESLDCARALIAKIYDDGLEINSIVFLQRYRHTTSPNFLAHCTVELFCIDEILKTVAELKDISKYVQVVVSSSPAAHRVVVDQDLNYHIVKSGQEALVRYLAIKHGNNRIRINALRIGSIVFKERALNYWNSIPEVVSGLQCLSAIGSILTSDSIGAYFANFVSSPLQAISGQVLSIDNGFSLMDSSQIAKQILENTGSASQV